METSKLQALPKLRCKFILFCQSSVLFQEIRISKVERKGNHLNSKSKKAKMDEFVTITIGIFWNIGCLQTRERQVPSPKSQETCSAEAILDEALKKRSSYDRIFPNDKASKLCFPDRNEVSTLPGTNEPFTSQGANTICLGVADCYFINVLALSFASPIAIYR